MKRQETDFERFGLYAAAVSASPVASDGQQKAGVWSIVWRVLAIVALLGLCAVPQALYCRDAGHMVASPGLLAYAGLDWETWQGIAVMVSVFLVGGLGSVFMAVLAALQHYGNRLAGGVVAIIACMSLVWAIPVGNAAGESLYWADEVQRGVMTQMPERAGLVSMLPGVAVGIVVVAGVAAVCAFLSIRRGSALGRRERIAYALASALALLVVAVLSDDLGAASAWAIRTGRPAYAMWPFAAIFVWKALAMTTIVVALIYNL